MEEPFVRQEPKFSLRLLHDNLESIRIIIDNRVSSHPLVSKMPTDSNHWVTNENQFTLTNIPLDLILEVLKLLDWRDIIRLQMTCRFFSASTNIKSIWVDLVNQHISGIADRPPLLERPIALYTSDELRSLLLLWKSAHIGLIREDGRPARERKFIAERSKFVYLVRGGRWLLVAMYTGLVMCYDLDAEIIEEALLIPEQSKPVSNFLMAVDVDTNSPTLRFNIAFSLHVARPKKIMMHVWRVDSLLDGNQRVIGLKATPLASFPHRPVISSVMKLSLLGSYIAFTAKREGSEPHLAHVFVLDWDRANGISAVYPWRMLHLGQLKRTTGIHLLPGNRIMVLSERIDVFDYSDVQETEITSLVDQQLGLGLRQLWASGWFLPQPYNTCGPFFTLTGVRVLANVDSGLVPILRSVDIHNISELDATSGLYQVMGSSPQFADIPYVGFGRALAVAEINRVETWFILDYSHFSKLGLFIDMRPIQKVIVGQLSRAMWNPILDEESGRIVSPVGRSKEINVLDFARIFANRN